MRLQSYPRRVQLTLAVYAIAFLIGTSTYLIGVLRGWWMPHHPFLNEHLKLDERRLSQRN
jgi:hypothetical protein